MLALFVKAFNLTVAPDPRLSWFFGRFDTNMCHYYYSRREDFEKLPPKTLKLDTFFCLKNAYNLNCGVAESGSIDELYALIDENPYILENIDTVPFVNTPLHVAAASGNIRFAMEMVNLKPSFARKLDKSGYSPLHLAVDKNQTDFVSTMLWLDHGLARVKGRNGNLVAECLKRSTECIQDVSVNGQNALPLAVMNDRFEVLQVLTGWIQRMIQRRSIEIRVLNKKDFSYNTALHLAAYKNDHQAVKLLLECLLVRRNKVNGDGLTTLDILRAAGGGDLDFEQDLVKSRV